MRMLSGMRHLLILSAAISAAACGHHGFKKEGATRDDFMQDLRQCTYEASRTQAWCNSSDGICVNDNDRAACMERKGWRITLESDRFLIPH